MVKILETAANVVGGDLFKQGAQALETLSSMVNFGTDAKKAKIATLEDVKRSYIDLAKSLDKGDEASIKTIEKFFGKFNVIYQSEFESLNKELSTIAAQKGGKDMSVFEKVTHIRKVMGSSIAGAGAELVKPIDVGLKFLNLKTDEEDYGLIRDKLEKLQEDVMGSTNISSDEKDGEKIDIVESQEIIAPMVEGVVTSTFHDKRNRDHDHDGEKDDHGAIDVVSYISKSLLAVADAKVVSTGFDHIYGAGNFIIIEFSYQGKIYKASYSHMESPATLAKDAIIKKGDIIGQMGNTGHASRGAHLHFKIKEVVDGRDIIVDPLKVFDPKLFRYKQGDQNVKFDDWNEANEYKK